MIPATKCLFFAFGIIIALGINFILLPFYYDLDVKTVTKITHIYDQPIFMTFRWIVPDEIQVGKLTTIQLEIQNLPYSKNMTLNDIVVRFDHSQLNYWIDNNAESKVIYDNEAKRQLLYPMKDSVILKPNWNDNRFESEFFNLRFMIPENILIQYCDYNLKSPCYQIENVIHPAPYDLDNRIQTNRIVIFMSLITIGLSSIVVWTKYKH